MFRLVRFVIYATFASLTYRTNTSPYTEFPLLVSNNIDICESAACWKNIVQSVIASMQSLIASMISHSRLVVPC